MAVKGGKRPGAGRPKGAVSQAKRDLMEMAKEHASAALKTLVDIARNAGASDAARVSAAIAILDRGYGKPTQSVEASVSATGALTVTYVTNARGPTPQPSEEDYETTE